MVPIGTQPTSLRDASLIVVRVAPVSLKRPVAVQRAVCSGKNLQSCDFLKNARLPPLGMAPACLPAGPPPPFHLVHEGRLIAERRLRSFCRPFKACRQDGRQPSSRTLSRRRIRTGFKGTGACQKLRFDSLSFGILAIHRSTGLNRFSPPSVWKNPLTN
jgi:hypothetical protein